VIAPCCAISRRWSLEIGHPPPPFSPTWPKSTRGPGLYLPAAYPSMYGNSSTSSASPREAAFKRIHAARTARRFPALFAALAEGRLHLSGVVMLAAPSDTGETSTSC